MEILGKLLDWDTRRFQLGAETPPDIKRFLRTRPDRKQLNRAHLAIYAAVKAMERRNKSKRKRRGP